MSSFKLVGAALVLAACVAVPVSAQQAIQEPGAYAFYHPNADVLYAGRPPAAEFVAPMSSNDAMAQMRMSVHSHQLRHTIKHN